MFEYIVHTTAQPTHGIISKFKIKVLSDGSVRRGNGSYVQPHIIKVISIGMPEYYIDIIERSSILYLKCKRRPFGIFPWLRGKELRLFKNIDGIAWGEDSDYKY